MSSLSKRVATTLIGVPAVFCIILLMPWAHNAATMVLCVAACIVCSREVTGLEEKHFGTKPDIPFWLPAILPVAAWAEEFLEEAAPIADITLLVLALLSFAREILRNEFSQSFSRMLETAFLLLYPNYFLTFLFRINAEENGSLLTLLFFSFVFANDIFAYIFGIAFGKSNKGKLKVSPNKSVAGFVGGHLCAVLWCILVYKIPFPEAFSFISIPQIVLMGLLCSFSANIGDLIESAIKRSVGVKDSGSAIPGRGGMLDSMDSLIATAPVFWILAEILFE